MSVQKYLMEMLNEGSCDKEEKIDESGIKDLLITAQEMKKKGKKPQEIVKALKLTGSMAKQLLDILEEEEEEDEDEEVIDEEEEEEIDEEEEDESDVKKKVNEVINKSLKNILSEENLPDSFPGSDKMHMEMKKLLIDDDVEGIPDKFEKIVKKYEKVMPKELYKIFKLQIKMMREQLS